MLETLRAALGSDAVRDGADTAIRIRGAAPDAVIAPGDEQQAAAAMRICAERGWTVRPAGAATWLSAGGHDSPDVVLTTDRLRGVIEYEPDDLAIAVMAGTPMADLDRTARDHGQFFAVRPPAADRATIGATISTASAGPLRLGHGTPRDHVLGLRLVTGDGRVLDLGGRVVKNVAGYDLVRLAVGSHGSLGLITRAFLRLRPLPERDITAFFRAASPAQLAETAMNVGVGWPVASELIDPLSAKALTGEEGWTLAVRWHGNAAFAAHITAWLDRFDPRPVLLPADRADAFWDGLARHEASATAAIRLTSLPSDLPAALHAANALAGGRSGSAMSQSDSMMDGELGILWRVAAHARSGILRVWSDHAVPIHSALLRRRLHSVRQQLVGIASVIVQGFPQAADAPGDAALEASVGPGENSGTTALDRLTRGIRRAFDPAGVLAPVTLDDRATAR